MALSQNALQAVLSSATEKTFLECLTIEHSNMDTLYLVNDKQDLTRSAATFVSFPFKVRSTAQAQDRSPDIEITATIVDQRVISGIRQLAGDRELAKITYEIVLADTPDTVEFGPITFDFAGMSTDGLTSAKIEASFLRGALDDAFPAKLFSPSNSGY